MLGYPHLSLMSFTYFQEEEVLIMTSRRNTQKLENLLRHPSVAVLVHDFPQDRETFVSIPPGPTSPVNPSSPEIMAAGPLAQQSSEAGVLTGANKVSEAVLGESGSVTEERAMYPARQASQPLCTQGRTCSVTVYGVVRIVEDPTKEEYYRGIHLASNPKYQNFIVGDDIAVLLVDVEAARMCNIHDRVSQWNRVDASETLQKSESLANFEVVQQKSSGPLTS